MEGDSTPENPLELPQQPSSDASTVDFEAKGGATNKHVDLPVGLRLVRGLQNLLKLKRAPKPKPDTFSRS